MREFHIVGMILNYVFCIIEKQSNKLFPDAIFLKNKYITPHFIILYIKSNKVLSLSGVTQTFTDRPSLAENSFKSALSLLEDQGLGMEVKQISA